MTMAEMPSLLCARRGRSGVLFPGCSVLVSFPKAQATALSSPSHFTCRSSSYHPEESLWHFDWVVFWSIPVFRGSAMTSRSGCACSQPVWSGGVGQGLCLRCGFLVLPLSPGPGWSQAGLEPCLPPRGPSSPSFSGFQVTGALRVPVWLLAVLPWSAVPPSLSTSQPILGPAPGAPSLVPVSDVCPETLLSP